MIDSPLAKQSLGQNFLADPNLARKLVEALDPQPGETVLEIGPGTGSLTAPLLESADRLIAVEIDDRLVDYLRERFGDRLDVRHLDILQLDLTALARETGPLAVLGNLPYYASSPILFHLLAHRRALSRAVVTLQTELAARCHAKPGTKDYGSLTIHLALYAAPQKLFNLPAHVFRPRPKVTSTALRFDFRRPAPVVPRSDLSLERVVRGAFGQRRKTLHNSLSAAFGRPLADELLARAAIDGRLRAEALAPADFVRLADALEE
ncbi:MAG: ribosomal RNA small subunit methyltransferase A [Myxococcales bacterium]|nr:ribosomal RNA small subunit methyltransferase A [Myxococcales bacterium]